MYKLFPLNRLSSTSTTFWIYLFLNKKYTLLDFYVNTNISILYERSCIKKRTQDVLTIFKTIPENKFRVNACIFHVNKKFIFNRQMR